ncbi:hypothetical protein L2089_14660 [Paenibacillus hunanensis]|uniref:hypothetical protein n=1 Tax=Paenibacillus hunanensis TaxID=539262 RepID=UPI0020267235|nr:hypothetical protein [Paenibacillus hunanensis]MCL9661941.1 hypothetical protein [Paenibacillus hunanensis]
MELEEAFNTLFFNDKKIENALSYIENNRQESINNLLKILNKEIFELENKKKETSSMLYKTLMLLAHLKATDAFPLFMKILKFELQSISPIVLGEYLSFIIPNENDISLLKDRVLNETLQEQERLVIHVAINKFYLTANKLDSLEEFLRDMIVTLDVTKIEDSEHLSLLFYTIEKVINLNFISLYKTLKTTLVQLIIKSKSGNNSSWFKNYFDYLYKLDPIIAGKIHEIESYIQLLNKCTDEELFQLEKPKSIGQFFFRKLLKEVKDTNIDTIKIAVKSLRQYPFNQRLQPSTDEEYYEEICLYLGIKKSPKLIYSEAQKMYTDIFKSQYPSLINKIKILINETEKKKSKLKEESQSIIAQANRKNVIFKDIKKYKAELNRNHFIKKELDVLVKSSPTGISGLLPYYMEQIEIFSDRFFENSNNDKTADEKLRKISSKCIFSDSIEISNYFEPYETAIKQLYFLLDDDPMYILSNIFYSIKFAPFHKKIKDKYFQKLDLTLEQNKKHQLIQNMNTELENHPLFPSSLRESASKSSKEYSETLEKFASEVITSIRTNLSNSICLKKRKPIIEYCLSLIENEEDELFLNLLPVQIEGLFFDLLENTTIFKYMKDIKLYQKTLNLEFTGKVNLGIEQGINIPFNAEAYFKYYFSSIMRNTVAHGNYALLFESKQIYIESTSGREVNDIIKRLIALELLLDLNYLIDTIYEINELDTANRYINRIANSFISLDKTENDKNNHDKYKILFEDLTGIGERLNISRYKSGIFITIDPVQILHWILDPYYENYLDKSNVNLIRKFIYSLNFWEYIDNKFEKGFDKKFEINSLQSLVRKMISIIKDNKLSNEATIALLKKINERIDQSIS